MKFKKTFLRSVEIGERGNEFYCVKADGSGQKSLLSRALNNQTPTGNQKS